MKKIKRNLLCIIFFLIILFINNKVKATNITISPTNPKVGDTVTVTVSVPNVNTVDVTANVSGVVSGNIKVVGGDLSGAAKSYSNSAQYKCDKEGTISVSVTSNSTAVLNGNYVGVSANKSVNVSKTSSNTSNSTEQKNNQSNQEKSKLFSLRLKQFNGPSHSFETFLESTDAFSYADIENICKTIMRKCILDGRKNYNKKDIEAAVEKQKLLVSLRKSQY